MQPLSPRRPSLSLRAPRAHRNLILKMVVLGILCYHWLGRRVGALEDQVRVGLGRAGGCGRGCPGPRDGYRVAAHSSAASRPRLTLRGLQAGWRPPGSWASRVGGARG